MGATEILLKQGKRIAALEAELKAAQDHAATMEACARTAEAELYHLKRSYEFLKIEVDRLHTIRKSYRGELKKQREELKNSVPFEVFEYRATCASFYHQSQTIDALTHQYLLTAPPITVL